MPATLLPTSPEFAATLTEIAPSALSLKAAFDPRPSTASFALDGIVCAVLAAENANNTVLAFEQRDAGTVVAAAGLTLAYGLAAENHVSILRSKRRIDWSTEPTVNKILGSLATFTLGRAQTFVDRRLGKKAATSWPAREFQV